MTAPELDPEIDPRAILGRLLREARAAAGKTQDAIGHAVGLERSSVTRAESGERVPTFIALGAWLTACGVNGLAESAIRGVWKLARIAEDPSATRLWFSGYLTNEASAYAIRIWNPIIIPGLVQVPDYARALFERMGMTPEQAQVQVDERMQRQRIFTRADPPNVTILVWEPVLHHLIGSAEVMREQCQKLLELPHFVNVQVVPNDIAGNAGLGGGIHLVDGPQGALLLAEAMIEDTVTSDTHLVRRASATFDAVRAEALPRSASRTRLTEAVQTWER